MDENIFLEIITVKNCIKYLKRCYVLRKTVDKALMERLAFYGFLELNEFSRFSPLSKDVFKIYMDDMMNIAGVLDDTQIFLTVSKHNLGFIDVFEGEVKSWCTK